METMTVKTKSVTENEGLKEIKLPFFGRKPDGTVYMVNQDGKIITVIYNEKIKFASIVNWMVAEVIIEPERDTEVHEGEFYSQFEAATLLLIKQANANI